MGSLRGHSSAKSVPHTNVTVLVQDAGTGQPVDQARLTLQFREPGSKWKAKLPHQYSYSAKTNPQGKYKFRDIPMGTIHLIVTSERHQSFGRDFEITEYNQVVEVKLKKPQPIL